MRSRVGVSGRSAVWTGVGSSGRSSAGSAAGAQAGGGQWVTRPSRSGSFGGLAFASSTRAQVQEADDVALLAEPERPLHVRVVGVGAGPPHRAEAEVGGGQTGVLGGGDDRRVLLGAGDLLVRLVLAGDDDHERGPVHLGEVLLDLGRFGLSSAVAVLGLGGRRQHRPERVLRLAPQDDEPPGPERAVVGRAGRRVEDLVRARSAVGAGWREPSRWTGGHLIASSSSIGSERYRATSPGRSTPAGAAARCRSSCRRRGRAARSCRPAAARTAGPRSSG